MTLHCCLSRIYASGILITVLFGALIQQLTSAGRQRIHLPSLPFASSASSITLPLPLAPFLFRVLKRSELGGGPSLGLCDPLKKLHHLVFFARVRLQLLSNQLLNSLVPART